MLLTLPPCCGQGQTPSDRIAYAPDVVGVGRLFLVALKVPVGTREVSCVVPDSVLLLDRTPLPAQSAQCNFYFRAVKPTSQAVLRFGLPEGEVTVNVEIWSFEDLRKSRTLKNVQLPRRWPLGEALPELKEGRTITTQAEIDALKDKPGGATAWLAVPDEDIWSLQPDSTIPRWHWVNIQEGCPVHGRDIYTRRAYYPWDKDTAIPYKWKIRCPVGGEEYPSNDFGKGDMTSGAYPDDGIGGGCRFQGRQYGFIAEICQVYCHRMLSVAPACAHGYLATGDVRYVHKALVAMCRLAVEWSYLATMTHHRHRNNVGQVERLGQSRFDEGPFLAHSGFTVYPIDLPTYQWTHAEAYDHIFPAIDKDPEIIPFLQQQGFPVKTHEDVRRFIEENLFAVWMQGSMDDACSSNEPFQQRGLVRNAEVLNYRRGAEFMDWLYDGRGRMRVFVPNAFFRDGAPYESTGGYNGMHVSALGPIVDSIEHLRELRPEVYPEAKYPSLGKSRRYRSVFDFDMGTVTIDRSFPNIGDTGGWPAYTKLPRVTWQAGGPEAYEHAYRLFRTPKFAWALAHSPGWKPSVEFPFTREQIEQEAAKWPDMWNDASSIHDGYGVAILRGGAGNDKRALWLRYGVARGHMQDDLMDIGLQGFEGILLSHMGYPRNWGYWEYSWTSHHLARQIPFQNMTAQAQLFSDAGPVQVTEARAQAYNDRVDAGQGYELPADCWQRRMLALVNVDAHRFYGVDLYRLSGGQEHWWAFHAQEGDFRTGGLELTAQPTGTLAGADVPYGDAKWLKANGCSLGGYGWAGRLFGFAHLYNVQRARPQAPWYADWALKNANGLHLRLTVPDAQGTEVNICDGTSPAGGHPYEMKWIMLHNKDAGLARSQVLSIIEPYQHEPTIQSVRHLPLAGEDEPHFSAAGCVLQLADRTDTVLAAADPTQEHTAAPDLRFAGRFGLYAEQAGEPVAMVLVGGTVLSRGGFGIRLEKPEYRARVTAVDRATETVTVSPAPPAPQAMVGATVFLVGPVRRSAYQVVGVKAVPDGAQLTLDLDSRIGTGRVTGVADFRVTTTTPFPLNRYRYYHGARLVNAARSAEYRLLDVRDGQAAIIDHLAQPEAKADRLKQEFAPDSWFDVYDYGVGDEVVWPYAVSVTRRAPGVYEVCAPAPVSITLPDGARTVNP